VAAANFRVLEDVASVDGGVAGCEGDQGVAFEVACGEQRECIMMASSSIRLAFPFVFQY